MRCKARLLRPAAPANADWSFLVLPASASARLPTRSMVSVEGQLAGQAFQATLEPEPRDAPPPNAEVAGWLSGLVGALPDTYREAVALSELEGLPHREVAGRLGLSPSGAKSRVARGRVLLKEALLRCCALEIDRRGNVLGYEPRQAGSCCDEPAGPGDRPC